MQGPATQAQSITEPGQSEKEGMFGSEHAAGVGAENKRRRAFQEAVRVPEDRPLMQNGLNRHWISVT